MSCHCMQRLPGLVLHTTVTVAARVVRPARLSWLALDLFVLHRGAREVSLREAALWSATWVVLALGFGGLLLAWQGGAAAEAYLAGRWLATLLLAVLVLIESTDVLFAIDCRLFVLTVLAATFGLSWRATRGRQATRGGRSPGAVRSPGTEDSPGREQAGQDPAHSLVEQGLILDRAAARGRARGGVRQRGGQVRVLAGG
jgi:hypothetical protein